VRERASAMRRSWIIAAGALAVIAVMVFGLSQLGPDPAASVGPSLAPLPTFVPTVAPPASVPTEPPGPTDDPSTVAGCTAGELALVAGGWSGATGSMGGGATVVNVSPATCAVGGQPALDLRDNAGAVIATGEAAVSGPPVILNPGGVANLITVWRNWCHDPPVTPLSLGMTLPDKGPTLHAPIVDWNAGVGGSEASSLPRCDAQGARSTIVAAEPFAMPPPVESSGDDEACPAEDLVAFLGSWGAAMGTSYASVVVFNQSADGCLLDGSPPVELRDATGKLIPHNGPASEGPPIDLPAGWAAQAGLGFADWCQAPPKLPFSFALRIGGTRLPLTPVSAHAKIGAPACLSDPRTKVPQLFLADPFQLPGS
jgi:hypothetical protein